MLGIGLTNYIPLFLYILGIVCIFVALFWKGEYVLFVLVPLLPLQMVMEKIHELPMGKDFVDILMMAMIFGLFVKSVRNNEVFMEKTSFNIPIMLLIFLTFISISRGEATITENIYIQEASGLIITWKNFIMVPFLFLITVNAVKDLKTIKILMFLMVIIMLPMDVYFIKMFRWYKHWHYNVDMREHGLIFTYLGPNELAAFFTQYGFIALGLFFYERSWKWRLLFLSIFVVNIYPIIHLYSRAAYLSMITGIVLFGVFVKRYLLIGVVLIIMFWSALVPVSVQERINMTQEEGGELDSSSQSRLDLWEHGFNVFLRNPVFGIGYGALRYQTAGIYWSGHTMDIHNYYLKILAEQGLIGFSVFILLYYLSLRAGWRLYRSSYDDWTKALGFGFVVCVIVNMIMNFFNDAYSYINLMGYYWVFLGLVVRTNIIIAKEVGGNKGLVNAASG